MKNMKALSYLVVLALGVLPLASCLEEMYPDSPEGEAGASFIDAYIEYPGPNAKWVGPKNFVMHISTREKTKKKENSTRTPASAEGKAEPMATISVTPKMFRSGGSRSPASITGERKGIGIQMAREEMAHLATALQDGDQTFNGCMSSVRVRMVRSDGTLLEKQGCRGQKGWPRVASEVVAKFMEAGR